MPAVPFHHGQWPDRQEPRPINTDPLLADRDLRAVTAARRDAAHRLTSSGMKYIFLMRRQEGLVPAGGVQRHATAYLHILRRQRVDDRKELSRIGYDFSRRS